MRSRRLFSPPGLGGERAARAPLAVGRDLTIHQDRRHGRGGIRCTVECAALLPLSPTAASPNEVAIGLVPSVSTHVTTIFNELGRPSRSGSSTSPVFRTGLKASPPAEGGLRRCRVPSRWRPGLR